MVRRIRGVLAASLLVASTAGCLFGASPAPLTFEPAELPDARVGTAYEAQITVSDNVTPVFTWDVRAGELPPGLTLEMGPPESDTGFIRGIPDAAGTYDFTVWVACFGTQVSGQTGTKDYRIVVH